MSKLEKTKSFCLSGLKKCKSLRELYQQRGSQVNLTQQPKPEATAKDPHKAFQHLDEFERNYLFSAGKRDLVRELRKNFEKQSSQREEDSVPKATYRKCDFSEEPSGFAQADAAAKKRPLNACHSFSVSSSSSTTAGAMKSIAKQAPISSEPPSWTQSAINLSTLIDSPIEESTSSSSDGCSSDHDKSNSDTDSEHRSNAVLLNNMRNSIGHLRANDGDTMSMCELSLYPVVMHNIADNNLLRPNGGGGGGAADRDSGISINNSTSTSSSSSAPSSPESLSLTTTTTTTMAGKNPLKLKKYSSVNQINLELLKSELNDFAGDGTAVTDRMSADVLGRGPWGTPPNQRYLRAPYHHRSASSLVSTIRRKVSVVCCAVDLEGCVFVVII